MIEVLASDTDETWPRPRDKFESPYRYVSDDSEGLDPGRLPPDGDLHSVAPGVHPRSDVDEERKITRFTGFKDRIATTRDEAAEKLRQETAVEACIEGPTEFGSGRAFHTPAEREI